LDPDNTKRQGTIGYMSPELIRGSGKYTAKIDAYAFGTLLWEMLTMKIPYHKMSSKQIETLVLKGERPAIPPSTPQELTDLIESCWKASPEDRPTFSQILEKILLFGATITVDDLSDTSVLSDMSPRNRSTTTFAFSYKTWPSRQALDSLS
jgi:serine/threonine protein kinase